MARILTRAAAQIGGARWIVSWIVIRRGIPLVVEVLRLPPNFGKNVIDFYYPFLLSICSKSPKMVQIWPFLRTPDKGLTTACIAMIFMDLIRSKGG